MAAEPLQPVLGYAYVVYGLLLPTWFALVGWKLLRLDRHRSVPKTSVSPPFLTT